MPRLPRILFIHDCYPAQFGGLAGWLAGLGWDVTYATAAMGAEPNGVRILKYAPHRAPSAATHPYAQPMERAAIMAQAFVRAALSARNDGYRPDIIVAHSGWGAGMFARDVFPTAKFVAYCEWWYNHPGVDVAYLTRLGFHERAGFEEAPMHERARNAPIAMDISSADAAICPTAFQAYQFPPSLKPALTIMGDGIDTAFFHPDPEVRGSTLGGLVKADARVVTYATTAMEPHRGFPQFMSAVADVLAADPETVVVVAGDNRVVYGGDELRRTDWKAEALKRHDFDPDRLHFVGRLGRRDFRRLLQRSDAHVYLTVPFVLSWSMLEAMSAGCALVLSDTAPVTEFADGSSAVLVDLTSADMIRRGILEVLAEEEGSRLRRCEARESILRSMATGEQYEKKRGFFADLLG